MSAVKICFATWELKNFTPGGIGVLVHNILKTYGNDPRCEISILWYGDDKLDSKLFSYSFPRCHFYSVKGWAARCDDEVYPNQSEFSTNAQWQSVQLMRALSAIEKVEGPFDVIEFPDFDGAAFATIQEKKLGRAFAQSRVAIRIHSTEAVLRRNDHRPANRDNAVRRDLERKALYDTDIVVAHLRPIVASVAETFNFPDHWRDKVIVELPPVLVDKPAEKITATFHETTPLVFTSKIQWFKQPQVFINGVVGYMRSTPDYRGDALLLAHTIDDELFRHCRKLVPDDLIERVKFCPGYSNEMRETIIARSVSINPSAYESFCLAAYEASTLGALSIINAANPAFGADTPWLEHVNCEKFDGTSADLVRLLCELWQRRQNWSLRQIALPVPESPYWLKAKKFEAPLPVQHQPAEELSLVVLAGDAYGDPFCTIQSALAAGFDRLQVILVYDLLPSTPDRAAILERLRHSSLVTDGTVTIVELGFRGGGGSQANAGLRTAQYDMVAVARAGASIDPAFLKDAVTALAKDAEFDFVIPQPVYSASGHHDRYVKPRIAEGLNAAVQQFPHLLGEFEFVARRKIALSIGFDESLDRFVDFDFHFRANVAGHRYILSNRIDAHLDLSEAVHSADFRRHLDAALVKHAAVFAGGTLNLASIYDVTAPQIMATPPSLPPEIVLGRRNIAYYYREPLPWWKVALRHPTRVLTWLLLREIQTKHAR